MRLFLFLTLFPLAALADTSVQIELTRDGEFFAVQHMCVKEFHQCYREVPAPITGGTGTVTNAAERSDSLLLCCNDFWFCGQLINEIHPTDFDGNAEGTNHALGYYTTSCTSGEATSRFELPLE